MVPKIGSYSIDYAREFRVQLAAVEARYHRLIRDKIEEQLRHEPAVRTTNRKPMQRPTVLGIDLWELRFGPENRFRIYYKVNEGERAVLVEAIGVKDRNRLIIGGREVEL
jgi:mRNA-degrading endonuclease RelE of RelBE toxin-antitoxin system